MEVLIITIPNTYEGVDGDSSLDFPLDFLLALGLGKGTRFLCFHYDRSIVAPQKV